MRDLFCRKRTCWETGGKILRVPLETFTSTKTCAIKNSYHFLPRTGTHLYKQREISSVKDLTKDTLLRTNWAVTALVLSRYSINVVLNHYKLSTTGCRSRLSIRCGPTDVGGPIMTIIPDILEESSPRFKIFTFR